MVEPDMATGVKIVNIDQGHGSGAPMHSRKAEMLLAKHLMDMGFQVVTSDEVSTSGRLSEDDIAQARKGNIPKARKVAATHDAGVVFIGFISTQVTPEEVLGIKMSKAVTTISYKVVDTPSGKVLQLDSQEYRGSAPSSQEAKNVSMEAMAGDLSQGIAQKIPAHVSEKDLASLVAFKKGFKSRKSEKAVVASTKKTQEKKTPSLSAQAGPQIIILKPPLGRGFKVVEKKYAMAIEGMAVDPSGIKSVTINGDTVDVNKEGRFSYGTTLSAGENHYVIVAMNIRGKTTTKEILIDRPEDKTPPQIVLIKPEITRGFTVVVKKPVTKTLVEGLVKDDSKVLYVRVNGEDVALQNKGRFSREIDLGKDTETIRIQAADELGNKTVKEFRVSRQYGNTRVVQQSIKEAASTSSPVKPVLWGLAIGVSRYDSTAVDLKYAANDAVSLANFLKKQDGKLFSEVHFKTLVDEDVTRDSIIESISTHLGRAAPNDVVFIFLAGHGIKHRQSGSYYFVPYNADYESILSKGLRMSDFEEAVNILSDNVNKVIIAMDTCHSGALQVGLRSLGGGEDLSETLREASGRYILAAAKGGEESLEGDNFKLHEKDTGHGVFTYTLIQAMSGKANYDGDDHISLNELFQYVAKQVPRLTEGRQHPYFRTEGTDMPFIMIEK
jgi:aromatic ring-opening dioxygenase LigB subunit